ncbi:MAG: response regulator [Planctomycetota bacterium]|nr:response regulator [Planctomycetota bacterium]
MKVLILDADDRFAEQARRYFESHAHLVVRAFSAAEALKTAQSWRPDLAVVDADQASETLLRGVQALPDRPAILMTGWPENVGHVWRAWQSGGDELLMKPLLHAAEIQLAVATALENAVTGTRGETVAA